MIYLNEFNIFNDDNDELIRKIINYINQYFETEESFIEVLSDRNINIDIFDYSNQSIENHTYKISNFNKDYDTIISKPQYTSLYNRTVLPSKQVYNSDVYQKIEDIFIKQSKKWTTYRLLSNLIKSFTMYKPTNKKVASRIMNIVGMGNDPKQIWEEFNNIQNDEFSYFKYPNTLDMNRLYDMLISDYEFDLNKRGEYELSRTIMLLKKNGIEIIEKI